MKIRLFPYSDDKSLIGECCYDEELGQSLERAIKISENGGLIAPFHMLVSNYKPSVWLNANSEDVYGIDLEGIFTEKGKGIVATIHGGEDGNCILTPDCIKRAKQIYNEENDVILYECAVDISKLFQRDDIITNLLNGIMPDKSNIPLVSFNELIKSPKINPLKRYAVIRSFDLARKTISGYQPIENFVNSNGNIKDSQIIAYCGNLSSAQKFIDYIGKKHSYFAVWNPFNSPAFDQSLSQVRIPVLGDYFRGFDTNNSLLIDGNYVAVTKKRLNQFKRDLEDTIN